MDPSAVTIDILAEDSFAAADRKRVRFVFVLDL